MCPNCRATANVRGIFALTVSRDERRAVRELLRQHLNHPGPAICDLSEHYETLNDIATAFAGALRTGELEALRDA